MAFLIRALQRGYKLLVRPFIGDVCRFYPSCSEYAVQAVDKHGVLFGSGLAIKRVLRCSSLSSGGDDPVPEAVGKGRKS